MIRYRKTEPKRGKKEIKKGNKIAGLQTELQIRGGIHRKTQLSPLESYKPDT